MSKRKPEIIPSNPALDEHVTAIRMLRSRIVSDVAEIGRRLIQVKQIVGHGGWLPWLEREFGWTDDTALNFMHVHEFIESLNTETVRDLILTLPVSSVYLLAAPSTPEAARDEMDADSQRETCAKLRELAGRIEDKLPPESIPGSLARQ